MRIEYEADPRAGQDFQFRLLAAQPPLTLFYYVGNRPYGKAVVEETTSEMTVSVPASTAGEFLRLVVQDAVKAEEYRLRIEETDLLD
jgi:hypothetical protein